MKCSRGPVSVALVMLLVAVIAAAPPAPAEAPAGQVTWAIGVSLPPEWFDPAEATGLLIPFAVYYALHDALVKPMLGNAMAEPGRVVERFAGRAHVRVRAASGRPLSQRRSADGRRRQILLRALPRRFGEGVEGTGAAGPPGRRPAPHTLPAQAAAARDYILHQGEASPMYRLVQAEQAQRQLRLFG
jgi:hypothetical protein